MVHRVGVRSHRLPHPPGRLTEHPLPTPDCEPHGLAFGPDGALYTALEKGEILRLVRDAV
ncbi:hypothetical protein ACIRP0_36115 [Streptomyces sp. NPDC101733]|uniref:hypothetical protein n=1 Tax=unclassified Streptomyces TaxID=2593676 RepID=UPI00380B392D